MNKNPLLIGLTGGMGSGQSTVCSYFELWGAKTLNADETAKRIIQHDKTLQKQLKKVFGNDIFHSGRLDRTLLAERAFKDEIHTYKLNQLVHPRMVETVVEKMERYRFSGKYPLIVVDAALIYEINIERNFDSIIVVYAPVKMRQKRVYQRDKLSQKQFNERVSKQLPLEDKLKWADFVIKNTGTLDDLKNQSKKVFDSLIKISKSKS